MTLSEYMDLHKLSSNAFSRQIGVSCESMRRYRHGERMPRTRFMMKIMKATGGLVTPNDFHAAGIAKVAGEDGEGRKASGQTRKKPLSRQGVKAPHEAA